MSDKMREAIRNAHDKARDKAWRDEPGTFDTLDAFKAGAAWQAAQSAAVPVVGDVVAYMLPDGEIRHGCECTAGSFEVVYGYPLIVQPTTSITADELDVLRQWFDCVQDVNGGFLNPDDFILAKKLYEIIGMRVPHSIIDAAIAQGKGE